MADYPSPIENAFSGLNGGKLNLSAADPASVLQIGFWPDSAATVHERVNSLFGLADELKPGRFAARGDAICVRTAYDGYLLIGMAVEELSAQFPADLCTVTDLSQARCGIAIQGPAVTHFLNRDIAVDFSPDACPVASAVQTTMHHVPVLLLRHSDERFVLYVYRSYARDLADWLADMAVPFAANNRV
jgi:sarcosine oxidase subunit gamma